MRTPPYIASYTETTWDTNVTSKTTAVVQWQAGDLIVCLSGDEGNGSLGSPAASGLLFSNIVHSGNSIAFCGASIDIARPNAAGASGITQTDNGTPQFGMGVWVLRNTTGIGSSGEQHTTTETVNVSAQQADSVMIYGIFDWSATSPVLPVVPTPTNARQAASGSGTYGWYVNDLSASGTTSPVAYGLSGVAAGPLSIVVAEVMGLPYGLYDTMAVQQRT